LELVVREGGAGLLWVWLDAVDEHFGHGSAGDAGEWRTNARSLGAGGGLW
jgi:hypothetical protein